MNLYNAIALMLLLYSMPCISNEKLKDLSKQENRAENSLGCDESCEQLFKKLKRFARNGSPDAQLLLAMSYRSGESSIPVNPEQAWRWIKRATAQRHTQAMYVRSQWHREGFGGDQDIPKANEFLEKAADNNLPSAIFDLAVLNFRNHQDQIGLDLLERAASMGYPRAVSLSEMLEKANQSSSSEPSLKTTKRKNSQTLDLKKANQEGEVITIVANQEDPIVLLTDIINEIRKTSLYNQKGTTGSRIGDRKCGQMGSGCEVIKPISGW